MLEYCGPDPYTATPVEGVTAPLAYCNSNFYAEADGVTSCTGVKENICFIQFNGWRTCKDLAACVTGGGKAAILYNRDGSEPCGQMSPIIYDYDDQDSYNAYCEYSYWGIPMLGLTLGQGEAIKMMLQAGQAVTATVVLPDFEAREVGVECVCLSVAFKARCTRPTGAPN
jgi:hypothetical protein